jgi:hypothetical protein
MDLSGLARLVGVERFERACAMAWATAEGTGRSSEWTTWPDRLDEVPHELADHVEDDLELAFALYRAMPCYANLMYTGYWGVGPAFWTHLRALLDHADPRLADPVLYWLWCGPFESADEDEMSTAWKETRAGADDLRLRRLLEFSGPVDWHLKEPILESLATRSTWRPTVRRAIRAAAVDYFGDIDMPAARRLLRGLGYSDTEVDDLLDPRADVDT